MTYIPNCQPLWAVISDPEVLPVCAWRMPDDDDEILIPMVPNSARGGLVPLADDCAFIVERTPEAVAQALKVLAQNILVRQIVGLRADGYTVTGSESGDHYTVTGPDPAKCEGAQVELDYALGDLMAAERDGYETAARVLGIRA